MFKIAALFEYVAENELVVVIVVHADGCVGLSAGVGALGAYTLALNGIVGACGCGLSLTHKYWQLAPDQAPAPS